MVRWLSSGADIGNEIRSLIGFSSKVDIAIAFWGAGAADALGLLTSKAEIHIICNGATGACNPHEIRKLVGAHPGQVFSLSTLHAKVVVADGILIVGSANASANGLGLEGAEQTAWIEAALITSDAAAVAEARAWFEQLRADSQTVPVDDRLLERMDEAWRFRQKMRPGPSNSQTLIDLIDQTPAIFDNRAIWVRVCTSNASDKADEEFQKVIEDDGRNNMEFEYYEGDKTWLQKIPDDAIIFDVWVGPRGRVEINRLFWQCDPRDVPISCPLKGCEDNHFQIVRALECIDIGGVNLQIDGNSKGILSGRLKKHARELRDFEGTGVGYTGPFSDFVRRFCLS